MTCAGIVNIESRDYWFKIVEFLQQNWALIEHRDSGVVVWFVSDGSGVFDEMTFATQAAAISALQRNGFQRYSDNLDAQKFISEPEPPFRWTVHPNGRIYSSGRFWK